MAGKKKTTTKRTSKGNASSKKKKQQEQNFTYEIILICCFAIAVLLELGNFSLCGVINYVSNWLFGVFGLVQYIMPIAVFLIIAFAIANPGDRIIMKRCICSGIILVVFMTVSQMLLSTEKQAIGDYFRYSYNHHVGGGVLGGILMMTGTKLLGVVGCYLVLCIILIICLILLTERSLLRTLKLMGSDMKQSASISKQQFDEGYEKKKKEHELTAKERLAQKRAARELAKEQAEEKAKTIQEQKEEEKTDRFQKPIRNNKLFQSMTVLSTETDQGIIDNRKDRTPVPRHSEEVHEIQMRIEDEPDDEMMSAPVVEEPKKRRTARKKQDRVVPDVLEAPVEPSVSLPVKEAEEMIPMPKVKQSTSPMTKNEPENVSDLTKEPTAKPDIQNYQFPPYTLLKKGKANGGDQNSYLEETANKLQETLNSFGVRASIINYSCGPAVTRYELQPEQGVKVSKIVGLADDIKLNLAAEDIRIEAPIPGKAAVGIEIPNKENSTVMFRDLIETELFRKFPSDISFAVGKDIGGQVVVTDIAKMPHLLIAGATGSGKSVCINTLIMSILYKAHPDDVKLIMIDPKVVELTAYNGIPHLLIPVVTDPKKAAGALNWAVGEMTKRYQLFAEYNVRNLKGYNKKVEEVQASMEEAEPTIQKLPQIVVIVDELADLMMVAHGEVEDAIVRLSQLARAAGIHLIIATQRPSVDVITGLIKANVPSRIAFSVSSNVDSRTILDMTGAEKLLGKGDMLFYPTGYPKPVRVQGAFISDEEVSAVVDFIKQQKQEETYDEQITQEITTSTASIVTGASGTAANDTDEYFAEAGRFIIEKEKASIGMLQRVYKIGFNRAARIMDQLADAGVVGPEEGTKPRKVLMSKEEFEQYLEEH